MLSITENARAAIQTAIEGAGRPIAGLRVMVEAGGCAGLRYGMALELSQAPDDEVVQADGVTVLLDPVSRDYLAGATIDFVTKLDGSGFVFDNPNASGGCGCGRSFC